MTAITNNSSTPLSTTTRSYPHAPPSPPSNLSHPEDTSEHPHNATHQDEYTDYTYPTQHPDPNTFIGNYLQENKPAHITRLYCHNLNGIKWDKHGGNWPMICEAMAAVHTDIACFSEINLDVAQYNVRQQMDNICKRFFSKHRLVTGSTSKRARHAYKPGGTAMLSVQNIISTITETTRDRMGRWTSTRYAGSQERKVTVISAYQVCQQHTYGPYTATAQQVSILLDESLQSNSPVRITPRQAFIRDLQTYIQKRQQEGDAIVLVGDFNDTMDNPTSGMLLHAV
jgi:exonuclease III